MASEILKKKIARSIRAACAPHSAEVHFETTGTVHVGVDVISKRFDKLTPSERQNLIWQHLDTDLTPSEAMHVSFIFAATPREHKGLADAGTIEGRRAPHFTRDAER
jgi:acid stress-induced BolA-like protein IbaG/YrbA